MSNGTLEEWKGNDSLFVKDNQQCNSWFDYLLSGPHSLYHKVVEMFIFYVNCGKGICQISQFMRQRSVISGTIQKLYLQCPPV